MSTEENKALVRRFVEEVQSHHNLDLADELFDPNGVNHTRVVPGLPPGLGFLDEFKMLFGMMLSAFPDIHAEIHSQVAEGDLVVTHKTFHGTHQAEFMGIPATGKHIEYELIDIIRVTNGKIAEHWAVADQMSLLQQLGVASPPGQAGT